jgi:hypothetical protein
VRLAAAPIAGVGEFERQIGFCGRNQDGHHDWTY